MPLPDFVIGGAPKCGTTALFRYLDQHPDVFTTDPKEPHYFASAPLGRRVMKGHYSREEYEALFDGRRPSQVSGEGSTHYLHHAEVVAPTLAESVPDARLIFCLRDPVQRAYSHYWFRYSEAGPRTLGGAGSRASFAEFARDPEVGRMGDYAANLAVFYNHFGREQVLVILLEDFRRDMPHTMRTVCEHIGVDSSFEFDLSSKENATSYPRLTALMPAADWLLLRIAARTGRHRRVFDARRRWLFSPRAPKPRVSAHDWAEVSARYRGDVERLADMIGRDLSHWLRPAA